MKTAFAIQRPSLHTTFSREIARGWVRDFLVGDAAGVPFCGEMTSLYGER